MSLKVAFIGAGSVGFTRQLLRDLLGVPEFRELRIAMMDIDEGNLERVVQLCQRDIDSNGLTIQIEPTTDQREAVTDAKYVVCTVRVGGLEAFRHDVAVPLTYGVDQCVGDTLGPGGVFYAQRGIPVLLNLCRDIREVGHPEALLLNYANPMAMLTWACTEHGGVDTVGLCHGVQGGHHLIANVLGAKPHDARGRKALHDSGVEIVCVGINHQTWYTKVLHHGKDVTDTLLEKMEANEYCRTSEKVRVDMMKRFGYFSTESNGHLSEYLPWYRKRPEEIRQWINTDFWINGETGGYLRICTESQNWFKDEFPKWLAQPPFEFDPAQRGEEHGSYIIEARETGRVYRGHFNRRNFGTITNLPEDCIIEAPGFVDRFGVNMPRYGDLPEGCAAVCRRSIDVQRLAVRAALTGDDQLLRQAVLLDPLTSAVCNPPEVWQMVDDMLLALAPWMPQYSSAIAEAKRRRESEPRLPTREDYEGAVRLRTRTTEELAAESDVAAAMESDKAKARG